MPAFVRVFAFIVHRKCICGTESYQQHTDSFHRRLNVIDTLECLPIREINVCFNSEVTNTSIATDTNFKLLTFFCRRPANY